MFGTFLRSLTLALFTAAAMPMAVQADQTPSNPMPLDIGEPRYYKQFDCKAINSHDEWNACWNESEQ